MTAGEFVDRFARPQPDVAYFDGHSLGRPTVAAHDVAASLIGTWATDLVEAWDEWIDRPRAVGDLLAPVLGAPPGTVIVGESTTVRLDHALHAACAARPERTLIVCPEDEFPTDRYVAAGVAAQRGLAVRPVPTVDDVADAVDDDVAAVVVSAVHFETAAVAPVAELTACCRERGAIVVWDCSHAAGAVPVDLATAGVDLAVGCTYKYLHGGPGAPAFVYVSDPSLRPPVQGWMAQQDRFAMGPDFDPRPGAEGWAAGTPGLLALEVAATGIGIVAEAGIDVARARSLALTERIIGVIDERLEPHGAVLHSPRAPDRRGGHVAFRHPDAARIVVAARAVGVVADHRRPDLVRIGPGPLATSDDELDRGLDRLATLVESGAFRTVEVDPDRVP